MAKATMCFIVLFAGFIISQTDNGCMARPTNSMTRIQEVFRTLLGAQQRPMMTFDENPTTFRGKKASSSATENEGFILTKSTDTDEQTNRQMEKPKQGQLFIIMADEHRSPLVVLPSK